MNEEIKNEEVIEETKQEEIIEETIETKDYEDNPSEEESYEVE